MSSRPGVSSSLESLAACCTDLGLPYIPGTLIGIDLASTSLPAVPECRRRKLVQTSMLGKDIAVQEAWHAISHSRISPLVICVETC